MAAKIISVCNQKGGCGKTTVTMALAAAYGRRGQRVLVVDGDVQGSALVWSSNAGEEAPFPAVVTNLAVAGKNLPREVRKLVDEYDTILIDCPPAVESPIAHASLLIADLALMPVIPSPLDVAAAAPFMKLVQQTQQINEQLHALVLPNLVQKNTSIASGYLEHFAELPLPTTHVQFALRTSHRKAAALGTGVEVLDREAKAEVCALLAEIDGVFAQSLEAEAVL